MTDTLPRAIADLCGILMGDTRRTAIQSEPRENALQLIEDGEGTWTLEHNGETVGWITTVPIMNTDETKYMATSCHHQERLCHSLNHAKSWLLSNYH